MKNLKSLKAIFVVAAFCCLTAISSQAQSLTTIASFNGTDGKAPTGSLIRGTDGNFYGTTSAGGANSAGTVFKVAPDGKLTTLYSFCSQTNCTDGSTPEGQLLQGKNGNFYGTTSAAGLENLNAGTIFEITPQGKLKTFYSFCSVVVSGLCADGSTPYSGLIIGADGNLYGTTLSGGSNAADNNCFCGGLGTIFKISPAGKLTTLYDFCNFTNSGGYCLDGGAPFGAFLQAANGNFYGMTNNGGTGVDNSGGTVFEMTPSGTLTTLYSFCAHQATCPDGAYPYDGLIQGKNGNFYGVTRYGGDSSWGTVFEITTTGKLTTLYRFSTNTLGVVPYSALVQGKDGNFYGTLSSGGPYSSEGNASGTAFKITPKGVLTMLYGFCSQAGCTDGAYPYAGLVQGANGDLYGVTYAGGANGDGTVFSLSTGLER